MRECELCKDKCSYSLFAGNVRSIFVIMKPAHIRSEGLRRKAPT